MCVQLCTYVCLNHDECDVESALIQPRSPAGRYLAGAIDIKELKSAMQSLGFDAKNHTVFQMIAELDQEGEGGSLDFDEFLHMMTAKMVRACLCVGSVDGGSVGLGPLTRRAEIEGRLNPAHPFFNPLLQSDKDSKEDLQKVFALFDDDQSGKITLRNLKRVAKELGEQISGAFIGDCEHGCSVVDGRCISPPFRPPPGWRVDA